ncbi:MAG TPA: NAD(P)H-dependent oxidoreductase [Paenibacillus sp.]|uniref:NAD(P)H-dependent oxidoreductase n=1 Tax=Paenibacillus TaxID=44249 RepID=UPI000BA15D38|nr:MULTISPECIES: NAD(P)H-dependent oxidoreductase [Paenibacillus]OZQ64473.1 NAD(P)H-dependent oxidoreductase [Paenibacillus taichungensis]HBU82502.1 NAD(P)H-dependent oxidoreductase [Paenibacillus sp.]
MNTMITVSKEQVISAFQYRHAAQAFDSTKKISEDDFNYILETGRLSPSSIGLEPWKFVVVQNPELRSKLKKISPGAQGQLDTASHFLIILARTNVRYDSEYVLDQMKNVQNMPEEVVTYFIGALKNVQEVRGLLENERLLYEWSAKQTYIAMGNMMTAAALAGIDSCPIEGFDYAAVDHILEEEGWLEGGNLKVSVMVAFGYRNEEPKRAKTRSNMEKIVIWS